MNRDTIIYDLYLPKVTIVTSVLNAFDCFELTIQSVISCNYKNLEFIVIDGNSKDETVSLIKKYESVIDYWISEKDNGIYDAWNKGLKVASGDWILFLGAGDLLRPNGISTLVEKLDGHSSLDIVSGKVMLFIDDNIQRVVGKRYDRDTFKKFMCIAHPSTLHSRDYFLRYGNFNDEYKIAGDYELLLRARSGLRSDFVNEVIVEMRAGGVSSSYNVFKENFRAQKLHRTYPLPVIIVIAGFSLLLFYVRKLTKKL
jgi:glycosyltransferase involved in cell wall biosynthesis